MKEIKAYKQIKIDNPRHGEICQGLIFSCAVGEEYPTTDVFGFVVTARCDIAQDKVHAYNYVPIVPLDEWLRVDGARIILDSATKNAINTTRSICSELNMSYSVVETEGLSSVCEKLSQTLTKSKDLKQLNKLKAQIQTIKTITNYDFDSPSATTTLTEIATPQIKDVLKRLFNHNLQGYYFLEKTEATGDSTGYVLLLREVRMIPDKLMKLVAQGLTQDEAKAMGIEHHIQFSENWDMAYPIGKLVSPTIEHVMQTFALLFSRIGVEDINDQYIQHMLTKFSE